MYRHTLPLQDSVPRFEAVRKVGLSALYNPPPPRQASAMIEAPSPNFDARDLPVSMIVLHYTGMETGEAAIARLRDPEAKVSSHYVVAEDGIVLRQIGRAHV